MKSNDKEYFLIFDTNILFQKYEDKANFKEFSFNSTYNNVIDMINKLDIYTSVNIVIPTVVWEEMKKQIIDKHDERIKSYKSTILKIIFPEFSIREEKIDNYKEYIELDIERYKKELSAGVNNNVVELEVASSNRFNSIISRAFEKRPPFEGKDGTSDKGFKDTLLWESIIEYVSKHQYANIIFYTKDKGFKEILHKEFSELYANANIYFCSNEDEVKQQLELWSKEIDIYSYKPIENYEENKELIDWIDSGDCLIQLIDRYYGLTEKNKFIKNAVMHLISYDNIRITETTDTLDQYLFDAVLEIEYIFTNKTTIKENINVQIMVNHILDEVFSVEDVYKIDDLSD